MHVVADTLCLHNRVEAVSSRKLYLGLLGLGNGASGVGRRRVACYSLNIVAVFASGIEGVAPLRRSTIPQDEAGQGKGLNRQRRRVAIHGESETASITCRLESLEKGGAVEDLVANPCDLIQRVETISRVIIHNTLGIRRIRITSNHNRLGHHGNRAKDDVAVVVTVGVAVPHVDCG